MRRIFKIPQYIIGGISYHMAGFGYTPLPKMMMFVVTRRCNSRCIMCKCWQESNKDEELSCAEIEKIFSDDFFKKIEAVIISGGEPFLRDDLPEIINIIYNSCPRLKHIWTSSNGFNPNLLKRKVLEIINSIHIPKSSLFTFNISIDGVGKTHDKIRGIKEGFNRTLESIQILNDIGKKYPINVSINTVIQPGNLTELEQIKEIGDKHNIVTVFSPLIDDTYFASNDVGKRLAFDENQLEIFRDFIIKNYKNSSDASGLFWLNYLSMLDGANRKLPCAFDRYAFVLEPTGDMKACTMRDWTTIGNIKEKAIRKTDFIKRSKMIRSRLKREVCPTCQNYCTTDFALQKEFFIYAKYYFVNKFISFF